MIAMLHFATLVATTIFATLAAVAVDWLLLHAAFQLMRPATVRRTPAHTELVHRTKQLTRAFAAHR